MTDQTGLTEQLERCEGLMLQGQDEQAAELLAHPPQLAGKTFYEIFMLIHELLMSCIMRK